MADGHKLPPPTSPEILQLTVLTFPVTCTVLPELSSKTIGPKLPSGLQAPEPVSSSFPKKEEILSSPLSPTTIVIEVSPRQRIFLLFVGAVIGPRCIPAQGVCVVDDSVATLLPDPSPSVMIT